MSSQLFIKIEVHIVSGDVPLLLGLEILKAYGFITDWGRDTVTGPDLEWTLLMEYKNGHAYIHDHEESIMFNRP